MCPELDLKISPREHGCIDGWMDERRHRRPSSGSPAMGLCPGPGERWARQGQRQWDAGATALSCAGCPGEAEIQSVPCLPVFVL